MTLNEGKVKVSTSLDLTERELDEVTDEIEILIDLALRAVKEHILSSPLAQKFALTVDLEV